MKQGFSPKELKTILFSKRANIYYLENSALDYMYDNVKEQSLRWFDTPHA